MRELREFDRQIKEKLEGYEYDLPEGTLENIFEKRTVSHKMINYFRLRWRRSFSILLMIFMSSSVILSMAYFAVIPFQKKNTQTLAFAQNNNRSYSYTDGLPTEEVLYKNTSEAVDINKDDHKEKEMVVAYSSGDKKVIDQREKEKNKKGNGSTDRKNKKANKKDNDQVTGSISSEREKSEAMDLMQMRKLSGVMYTLTDTLDIPKSDYADEPLLKNKKADRFRVDLYTGPAFLNRAMVLHSQEYNAYKNTRKNAESFSPAFSAGMRLNYAINENWSVQGGISYTSVKEKIRLILKEEVESMRIDTTIIYIQTPNNPPQKIYKYDTVYNSSLMDHYQSADSRYTFIDIPLTLNYTLQKGRWNYSVGGGVIWNIMLRSKGSYINDSLQVASYSEKDNPYTKSLRLGLTGSVGVRYHLNEKWSVFTEPTYYYYVTPVTKSSTLSKDYFNTFYLNSGVSYRF